MSCCPRGLSLIPNMFTEDKKTKLISKYLIFTVKTTILLKSLKKRNSHSLMKHGFISVKQFWFSPY